MIGVEVLGQERIASRLHGMPSAIKRYLQAVMRAEVINLQSYIKSQKLSGQVLKNRTGTLRRSIFQRVTAEGSNVAGFVGTPTVYGPPHEFGGRFKIPKHQVRQHIRNIKQAFGKAIEERAVVVQAHSVRAHTADFPMRSFMRSSFSEKKDGILANLKTAVKLGVESTKGAAE